MPFIGDVITDSSYFNAATHTLQQILTGGESGNHNYVSEDDTEEDNTTTQDYKTVVVYGTPMRETKALFVPELADGVSKYGELVLPYTKEELNTVYHSVEEYQKAVERYGFVYKHKKFENADNTEDLLNYALDYIKNNYHGGLVSFTITALDMHLAGFTDQQKFTVGRRVNVKYMDPETKEETGKTLTIISAEYDLNNPEKNSYKIGVPDVVLDKVYGETSTSGGGGGGGGKDKDENDEEEENQVETIQNQMEGVKSWIDESFHALITRNLANGSGKSIEEITADVMSAMNRTGTNDFFYSLTPDNLVSSFVKSAKAKVDQIVSNYINVKGLVDTDFLSADKSDVTSSHVGNSIEVDNKTKTKDFEATNNADVKNNLTVDKQTKTESLEVGDGAVIKAKTKTKTLEVEENASAANVSASGTVSGATGSFTSLVVGGQSLSPGDIPSSEAITNIAKDVVDALPKVTVTIGETRYRLYGKKLDE